MGVAPSIFHPLVPSVLWIYPTWTLAVFLSGGRLTAVVYLSEPTRTVRPNALGECSTMVELVDAVTVYAKFLNWWTPQNIAQPRQHRHNHHHHHHHHHHHQSSRLNVNVYQYPHRLLSCNLIICTIYYIYIFFILTLPSLYLLYLRSVSKLKDNRHLTVGSILPKFLTLTRSQHCGPNCWINGANMVTRRREMDFHGSWRWNVQLYSEKCT